MTILSRLREAYRMQEHRTVEFGRVGPLYVGACGFELVVHTQPTQTHGGYMLRAGYSPMNLTLGVRVSWPPAWARKQG